MIGYNLEETTKLLEWAKDLRIWDRGKPSPIWITHLEAVENTIHELKLKPLAREHYPNAGLERQPIGSGPHVTRVARTGYEQPEEINIPDFPGGLKCPHLHFKRDIYLLDDRQWKTFSNEIVKGFSDKLASIGTVNFGQLLQTSEAIDSLS
mgnify:CR=1 FL=1